MNKSEARAQAAGSVPAAMALFGCVLLASHLTGESEGIPKIGIVVFVFQVACLPLAIRFPRSASLIFAVSHVLLAYQGIGVGVMVFFAFVLSLIVSALGHWKVALLSAFIVSLSVFFEPIGGFPAIPPVGILINGLLFFGPIPLGWWISTVRRDRIREAKLRAERALEMEQVLHDSVAANLSSIVVRLQGLSVQDGVSPLVSEELDEISDTARDATRQVRELLSPLGGEAIQSASRPVSSLVHLIHSVKEDIQDHGFVVNYSMSITDCALSATQLDLIRGMLEEAAINVIKYGQSNEPVLFNAQSSSGKIVISLSNSYIVECGTMDSTRLGLSRMAAQVESTKGEVKFLDDGTVWSVEISIPIFGQLIY